MNNINVLDCTLRDGGYCNQWHFGYENTKRIITGLVEADVDIVECGFLTDRVDYNRDITKFTSVSEISDILPDKRKDKLFVAMMNYGEYDVEKLPIHSEGQIDGIRVAFHKKNRYEALKICERIMEKGYLVFIQAMVSLSYSDEEFLELLNLVNKINPYAFYIVDSFGYMKGKDLTRLFYMVEHNLNESIWIGFHSHNNMQLAYSNAQRLCDVQTNRNLIIDSTILGMGRGAGNLNTELLIEYLNENNGKNYLLKPILGIIDAVINRFYQENYWGYSLANYISAVHNAHPNYASYLDDKKTLTVDAINEIFDMMEEDKKVSYDHEYMEELYLRYMESGKVQEEHKKELEDTLSGKKVLLIAPGKSSSEEVDDIKQFVKENEPIVISINFVYEEIDTDYVFLSNMRRYRELPDSAKPKCIVTSNIPADGIYYKTQYRTLLNNEEAVFDNAGLMAIRFLMNQKVSGIYLAGFDGYSHDVNSNYGKSDLALITKNAVLDAMNDGMRKVLALYSEDVKIQFVTKPRHITDIRA